MKGARLSSTKSPSGGWATLRRSPRPYFGCARRTRPSPSDTPWSSTAARPRERPEDCPATEERASTPTTRTAGRPGCLAPRTHPPGRRCLAEAVADRPDRPVLPDQTVYSLRHVQCFGVAVDLHPRVGDGRSRATRPRQQLWWCQSIGPSSAYCWLVSVPAPLYSSSLTCSPQ